MFQELAKQLLDSCRAIIIMAGEAGRHGRLLNS